MTLTLGKLEKVDLREYWKGEAADFTPWLAQNLTLLGDAIGLDLELEGEELGVGPFRADTLCKDTTSNAWVLIENQLERTDHTHLGQLMTYAAGLDAATIIWVAQRFTDEHRAALDWLNRITADGFHFFGLEVELWRIGESAIAPKFNVICKPNDWAKSVTRVTTETFSETKQLQLEYWQAFREYLLEHSTILKPQAPLPQHCTYLSVGRSCFTLDARVNTKSNGIGSGILMTDGYAKSYFDQLNSSKQKIEQEIGTALLWERLDDHKRSQIKLELSNAPLTQREDWLRQFEWLKNQLERFHKAFSNRVKQLKQLAPEAFDVSADEL
jgi:Domain of unknown function (DUF4268)